MWMDKDERNAFRQFAKDHNISMAEICRQGIMSIISKKMEPVPDSKIHYTVESKTND